MSNKKSIFLEQRNWLHIAAESFGLGKFPVFALQNISETCFCAGKIKICYHKL